MYTVLIYKYILCKGAGMKKGLNNVLNWDMCSKIHTSETYRSFL